MHRDVYIRDVYSKYWIKARERKYGFSAYDRNICEFLLEQIDRSGRQNNRRLLEVAVGTGYPIANYLQRKGFDVHGLDISPRLVERCRELNPDIRACVGNAECLQYPSDHFDAVYCVHSTWLFSNLSRVIAEMMRVVSVGGVVMFDVQNRDNAEVMAAYRKQLWEASGAGWFWRQAKNIAKAVARRGYPQWRLEVHQVPSDLADIRDHISVVGCAYEVKEFVRLPDDSIRAAYAGEALEKFARIIYVVHKCA